MDSVTTAVSLSLDTRVLLRDGLNILCPVWWNEQADSHMRQP